MHALLYMMKRSDLQRDTELYRIWNNLMNAFITLVSNNFIDAQVVINHLLVKLRKEIVTNDFSKSRDWLMWLFVQVITATRMRTAQAQKTNDFNETLEIFDLLYRDGEELKAPQPNSFSNVIKYSTMSLWIILNRSSDNAKMFIAPDILRNYSQALDNLVSSTHQDEFTLPVCLNTCKFRFLIQFWLLDKNFKILTNRS